MKAFKPDAAAGLNRNATTSACVGWDRLNIEKRAAFRKQRKSHTSGPIPTFAPPSQRVLLRMLELKDHEKSLIMVELWI
jgi:hypothetical protein